MTKFLRIHPLQTSFIIIIGYALWFILPAFFIDIPLTAESLSEINNILRQWKTQLIILVALILLITYLDWWREIGFIPIHSGGLKFLLPPLLFLAVLFLLLLPEYKHSGLFGGFKNVKQVFSFLLILLMLGFTEETVFRGILFHGLETKVTPLQTVLISAIIFGLFHYLNMLVGAHFYSTTYQVIHAAASGFMYATLRLRIGAIWPVMIFHTIWDIGLILLTSIEHPKMNHAQVVMSFSFSHAIMLALPAISYGTFVYWRWTRYSNRN